MDKRLASRIVFVFGAVTLLIIGVVPSFAAPKVGQRVSRDECLEQVGAHISKLKIDDQMRASLNLARTFYRQESYAYRYKKPEPSPGCRQLSRQIDTVHLTVPCFNDRSVMGDLTRLQKLSSLIEANKASRYVIEVSYACKDGRVAGNSMRDDGLFAIITEQPADRAFIRRASRGDCIKQAATFYDQVEVDHEAGVSNVRDYYLKFVDRSNKYQLCATPWLCDRLETKLDQFDSVVPCYKDATVMTDARIENFLEVVKVTENMRLAHEAKYACRAAKNSCFTISDETDDE